MGRIVEWLNAVAVAWAGLVWAVVWQSTLLAFAVAGASLLLRRSAPGVRYWLWQIVALKLLLMPFWTVAVPLPALSRPDPPRVAPAKPTGGGRLDLDRLTFAVRRPGPGAENGDTLPATASGRSWLIRVDWKSWLLLGWLLAVTGQVAGIVRQRGKLARLLRESEPASDPELLATLRELSGRIGLRRPPAVVITEGDGSPFVCGLRRPAMVLPRGLIGSLDADQWRQVLLHELAHIKRGDLIWGWVPELARVLFFFHPVSHWVAFRIRLERELACDQAAMALTGLGASGYAETLVRVVSHASRPAVLRAALSSAGLDGSGPGLDSPAPDRDCIEPAPDASEPERYPREERR
jgi:hypothetical protein